APVARGAAPGGRSAVLDAAAPGRTRPTALECSSVAPSCISLPVCCLAPSAVSLLCCLAPSAASLLCCLPPLLPRPVVASPCCRIAPVCRIDPGGSAVRC